MAAFQMRDSALTLELETTFPTGFFPISIKIRESGIDISGVRKRDRISSMGIFLGIVAALFWGAGDMCARFSTHRIGTYRTLFFMQFVGFTGLSIFFLITGQLQHIVTSTTWQPWVWAALAALLNVLSSLALYRAFEVGTLTLVSPIASSYAAVTAILAFLSGEALTSWHSIAIWLILLGVIIAATPLIGSSAKKSLATILQHGVALQGIGWAVAAALGYGLTFWVLGFHVTALLGGIVPVWLVRGLTPCILVSGAPLTRQSLRLPRGGVWWYILGVSVFDTVAYIAYTSGLLWGQVSLVTMLSSLYSAVTVLLAWIFLRERLQPSQWIGIGVIFVGIVLVNV